MNLLNKFLICICLISLASSLSGQELKVTLSPDDKKIDRNAKEGVSTIVLDSHVKDLEVRNETDDELIKPSEDLFIYRIDTKKDLERGYELSQRTLILNSPKTSEYLLEIDEILPNRVLYYTIVMSEQYPSSFTCEYLFTKSAIHGIRVSYGKRVGFYLGYKWGHYKKAGANILEVNNDYDVTRATRLGYIRNAYTGGLRFGILHKEKSNLYILAGGGYGEYGRQWENLFEVDKNIYFYSDYIKGFEGEIACQYTFNNWLCLSVGADALFGKGKVSVDYQLGIGINLNVEKFFKHKI